MPVSTWTSKISSKNIFILLTTKTSIQHTKISEHPPPPNYITKFSFNLKSASFCTNLQIIVIIIRKRIFHFKHDKRTHTFPITTNKFQTLIFFLPLLPKHKTHLQNSKDAHKLKRVLKAKALLKNENCFLIIWECTCLYVALVFY